MRKSHNWIVGREMSYVIIVHAAEENLRLFRLCKIFVERSCSTPTNHSKDDNTIVQILIGTASILQANSGVYVCLLEPEEEPRSRNY